MKSLRTTNYGVTMKAIEQDFHAVLYKKFAAFMSVAVQTPY